jgi:hypothetical protein
VARLVAVCSVMSKSRYLREMIESAMRGLLCL